MVLVTGRVARIVSRRVGWLSNSRAWPVPPGRTVPLAVVSAALTPVLLITAFLVADAVQPASYSPMRDTVSALAGQGATDRWIMTAGLFLVGSCYFVTAAGLAGLRLPGRLLLILAGLCAIGIATTPEPAQGPTALHLTWTAVGAATIAVWPAVAGWGMPRRPAALSPRCCAITAAVFVALLAWVVVETQGGSDLGLAERLASALQVTWPFVIALALYRGTRQER